MSAAKDWASEAAAEIYETGCRRVVEVIVKHCPFKPGVAYMPVPRCDSCKHGVESTADSRYVRCQKISDPEGEPMYFESDFGCVQWEAK